MAAATIPTVSTTDAPDPRHAGLVPAFTQAPFPSLRGAAAGPDRAWTPAQGRGDGGRCGRLNFLNLSFAACP